MTTFHKIHCIVQCNCGKWINVRAKFSAETGWSKVEPCWNCHRAVELRGRTGYCENRRVKTQFVSEETVNE